MPYDAWAAETEYKIGDIVTHNDTDYICIADHESDITITEPDDSTHWEAFWNIFVEPEKAQAALGTEIQRGDGEENETFAKIAKCTNISGPSLSLDLEDVTDHDSPEGWEEMLATILRSGEVTLDISFLPNSEGHKNLIRDMVNKVQRNFKLVFPDTDNTTWSFTAYVTGFEPSAPHDNKIDASVTIKPTGKPTLALGA